MPTLDDKLPGACRLSDADLDARIDELDRMLCRLRMVRDVRRIRLADALRKQRDEALQERKPDPWSFDSWWTHR